MSSRMRLIRTLLVLSTPWISVPPARAAWTDDGVQIEGMNGAQFVAIRDGTGGAIVVGIGAGPDPMTSWDVQAQRITSSGARWPGWPSSSVYLCAADRDQSAPQAVPDGAGGAIVAWVDQRDTLSDDLYVHRVLGDGSLAPGWPDDGLLIVRGVYVGVGKALIEDSQGGAFVVWAGGEADHLFRVRALRVMAAGYLDPAWPEDGLVLCAAPGELSLPRGIADGTGSAYVTWQDLRGGSTQPTGLDIYAHRFTAAGTIVPGWPANGLAVSTAPSSQTVQTVSLDPSGHLFVSWQDGRNGNLDVYALRVRPDGTRAPGWTSDGSPLVTQTAYQYYPIISSDGSGGALVIWEDFRSPDFDVYGQHLRNDRAVTGGDPRAGKRSP